MPDTVVQFINVTDRTYEQLLAGVTIASNTANEQAVVKDVYLNNPSARSMNLTVGSSVAAQIPGAITRLTGSELIGASTSLNLNTTDFALFNRLRTVASTTTLANYETPTQFSGTIPTVIPTTSSGTAISPSLSGIAYFQVFAANGDFYYSNNGGGALFRRAGGFNGSQTQITTWGASPSFDGRYIYSWEGNGTNLAVIDTQNNGSLVTRSITGLSSSVATGIACASAIDGYVWIRPNSDSFCFLVNPNTSTATALGGINISLQERYFNGIGRASSGDYMGIQFDIPSNAVRWWNFGNSLATPFIKASGSISKSANNWSNPNTNNLQRTPGSNEFFVLVTGSPALFDLDLLPAGQGITDFSWAVEEPPVNSGKFFSTTLSRASTEFGTVGVRATGIKTTP